MTETDLTPDAIMPFAGDPLDYAENQRDVQSLERFVAMSAARCLLLFKGRIGIGDGGRPHRVHPSDLVGHNLHNPGPIFLGLDGKRPIFAASLQTAEAFLPEENFIEMRTMGVNLSTTDLALAGRAKSLFDWHHTHRNCIACGSQTVGRDGGVKQQCTGCGRESFPRVSPVVIMLVTHEDKLLLGRGVGWPDNFYSALAGFVSPGETIEEAVGREVLEEAGIRTTNMRYLFSHPWPYPAQLMMAVTAEAKNTDVTVDPKELDDARWFTREEVRDVMAGTGKAFMQPPQTTIAHQMLRYWLGT
jgi:NAD+ diphosphatase